MKATFSTAQKRIVLACTAIYTAAYLNRLNLAAALGYIAQALHITPAQAGLLQTAFAISYAAGQMINGALVDHVNPVRHMLIGITGSSLCNVALGLCHSYAPMVALLFFNGVFQSMLWTPIVRLIALHFVNRASQEKANIIISLTLIMGHLGAWAISGYLSNILSWRFSFIVPGLLCIPAILTSAWLFRGLGNASTFPVADKAAPATKPKGILSLFTASGFLALLVSCVLFGFVRDGINTWTPTILADFSQGNAIAAVSFSLIIPLINACGMLLAYSVQRGSRLRNRRLIAVMMALSACFCLPLIGGRSMLVTSLLLGCCCAYLAGLGPVLTALVPLEYSRENLVGLTAGLIDSLIYFGSALAGVTAGALYGQTGTNALFICWAMSALLAAGCALLSGKLYTTYQKGT